MDDEFGIGEIRIFAGNYDPIAWLPCNGQLLLIDEYGELFALIGNRFGGDGQTTFALPNLPDPGAGLKYVICFQGDWTGLQGILPGWIGQVRLFAGQVVPPDTWFLCNGATLSIVDYEDFFAIIGTAFGGNGASNFVLPTFPDPFPGVKYIICYNGMYPT